MMSFPGPLPTRKVTALFAIGLVALQACCLLLVHGHALALSPFLFLPPLFAVAACLWRAHLVASRPRLLWTLTAVGVFIWSIAAFMATREEFILRTPDTMAAGSQIAYFLYGLPLLLALGVATGGSLNSPLFWLDAVQVAIACFLIYLQVFNVVPFLNSTRAPAAVSTVVFTFNVENLVLAIAATLRALSAVPGQDLRRFYRCSAIFLWTYAIGSAIYNYITLRNPGEPGVEEVLAAIPFLLLVVLALKPSTSAAAPAPPQSQRAATLSLMMDNASPAIFPAGVIALGISIARRHFISGTASIAVAVLVYIVRSTLLQIQYLRAQAEARASRDRMEIVSLTDPLTGIPNRRHFDRVFTAEWNRLSRQPGPLSLLLIDIDHFKFLNDAFGHGEGDICLRQVAHVLQASLRRESDTMARYGGEEFVAVLPSTDAPGAEAVARRMAETLRSMRLRARTPLGNAVTISIGRATCESSSGFSPDELLNAADRALYRAKRNGRDRSEVAAMRSDRMPSPV
jgi:diguanylate cyclase (GGDEF)-like protein